MTLNRKIEIARAAYRKYWTITNSTLMTAYNNPSHAKINVWEYWNAERQRRNGFLLKILSHNKMRFTCGYEYSDPKTGVVMFKYIAPTWEIEIEAPIIE